MPLKKVIKVEIEKNFSTFYLGPKASFDCYPLEMMKDRLDSLGNIHARNLSNFLKDNYDQILMKIKFFFHIVMQ